MNLFLESLCVGLVRQLTNIPADCRIEQWLHEKFDGLRDMQAAAVHDLHSEVVKALETKTEKCFPPSVYLGSNAMSYVLAKAIGNLFDEAWLGARYVEKGFAEVGEKLNSYMTGPDNGHVADARISDAWARELGMVGWYSWVRLP